MTVDMSSRGRRRGARPRADDTRVLMPIATHRAARIGRAEAARDAAEGPPRTSARAVDVPCIIGATSAREPREDGARHDARSTHPASPRCARDASAETLAVARARLRAGAGVRTRARASRESGEAREPTAGVSCERAVPPASRGVSRADPRDAASADKSARDTWASSRSRHGGQKTNLRQ